MFIYFYIFYLPPPSLFDSLCIFPIGGSDSDYLVDFINDRIMGNAESNESAAVKRQAEGFSNPMYRLLDLGVTGDHLLALHLLLYSLSREAVFCLNFLSEP